MYIQGFTILTTYIQGLIVRTTPWSSWSLHVLMVLYTWKTHGKFVIVQLD